jgi:hypothetical protein
MNQQLPLFTLDAPEMPDPLLLRDSAALVLSVSRNRNIPNDKVLVNLHAA